MDYNERDALRARKAGITVNMPLTLLEVVDRYADAQNWSSSATIVELIRTGLRTKAENARSK